MYLFNIASPKERGGYFCGINTGLIHIAVIKSTVAKRWILLELRIWENRTCWDPRLCPEVGDQFLNKWWEQYCFAKKT